VTVTQHLIGLLLCHHHHHHHRHLLHECHCISNNNNL